MLDQNTDRASWGMLALVLAGISALLVKSGGNEIGNLVLNSIKALFVG
ncbi:hypothetical protein C672_3547 [[Clostridium] bifermentans ATCC 638]|uniref:Uncharacterized protein n=1 Tax=Paraclostridium bifermentans ATCC 638 = DSM 14991 TaxID=1233171 RepID=T4VFR1_PARBF|nr:hypothetical protein [Paraclostridium bifermentans]EQK39955.1 hypothetical protein C672_3547 [[Clostridium] bifermentans ATCC 638] [Paraclostridium bifermentans ATCC 638 = DSM 14991]UAG19938.1 hypothetical protein KXZ80_17190 [Paraclostridium bifermentans]